MKTNDFIYFSIIKLFRNKKNIFLILLYIICTVILFCGLAFRDNFSNYIYNTITKNIGFRSIMVSPNLEVEDYGLSQITTIEHVVDVYNSNYDFISVLSDFKSNIYDGYLDLNYGNSITLPEYVVGDKFTDSDTGVAICPINFFPSSEAVNLMKDEKKIINGYDLLDTEFEVTYYSYYYESESNKMIEKDAFNKTFKIVGLYDNTEVMYPNNTCYVSSSDIIEMKNATKVINDDNSTIYGFIIVVDEKENVIEVANELVNMGFFQPTIKNQLDTSITDIILLSCNILISVIMCATILLTIFYIRKKTTYMSKEIGILRACGYKKTDVILYCFLEMFLTNIISYFVGILISLIIFFALKFTWLKTLIYSGVQIKLFAIDFIFVFCIIVIVNSFINIYYILRATQKSINDLVGEAI